MPCFYRTLLLADGRIAYLGPSREAVSYFGRYIYKLTVVNPHKRPDEFNSQH